MHGDSCSLNRACETISDTGEPMSQQQTIYGYNAAAATISRRPDDIIRLHFIKELAPKFGDICRTLAATRRIYRTATAAELEAICKSSHHEGVVLITRPTVLQSVSSTDVVRWKEAHSLVLAFDNVGNPHNMGAMIRSAAFLGVRHVIVETAAEGTLLTASAFRVAEGGMEHVTLRSTPDLSRFIKETRSEISAIGTDQYSRIPLADIARQLKVAPRALMLVMGNEEHGLSRPVRAACSELVAIPGRGVVESLNVVTAAAICMYELCRPIQPPSPAPLPSQNRKDRKSHRAPPGRGRGPSAS